MFEDLTPAEAAARLRRRAARPAAQGQRDEGARARSRRARKIVDMSGDFRLRDAARYEKLLRRDAPAPRAARHVRLRPARAQPRRDQEGAATSRRPGCFATTIELGAPAARAGGPARRARSSPSGITGSSGSRRRRRRPARTTRCARSTSRPTSRSSTSTSPRSRRRSPTAGAKDVALRFVPVSAPLSRGIFATCFVAASTRRVDAATARARCSTRPTRGEPFVRVPDEAAARGRRGRGSNYAEVGFAVGPAARTGKRIVTCFSAIDNLIKGGAGQAIQTMNLMLGLDERLDLEDVGDRGRDALGRQARRRGRRGRASVGASPPTSRALVGRGHARRRRPRRRPAGDRAAEAARPRRHASSAAAASPTSATLDVMKMVVAGKLNVDLCAALVRGRRARRSACTARAGSCIDARRGGRPRVVHRRRARAGRPRLRRRRRRLQPRAPRAALGATATCRCSPASAPTPTGGVYNINADIVANQRRRRARARRARARDRRAGRARATSQSRVAHRHADGRGGQGRDPSGRREGRHDPQARGVLRRHRRGRARGPRGRPARPAATCFAPS